MVSVVPNRKCLINCHMDCVNDLIQIDFVCLGTGVNSITVTELGNFVMYILLVQHKCYDIYLA